MMSKTTTEQQFGYLALTGSSSKKINYIKANKITSIEAAGTGALVEYEGNTLNCDESVEKIFDQLECIHPTLR